jgi:hypothetical protein
LTKRLAGKVDYVYVDRMNYASRIRKFYHAIGLKNALTDAFFQDHKERFIQELKRRKISFEIRSYAASYSYPS